MSQNVDEGNDDKERQEDIDRLYKKMSVEKHEKLKRDMRDLITRFRMRGQKYEEKVTRFNKILKHFV